MSSHSSERPGEVFDGTTFRLRLKGELNRAGASGAMERVTCGRRFFPDTQAADIVIEELRRAGSDRGRIQNVLTNVYGVIKSFPWPDWRETMAQELLFDIIHRQAVEHAQLEDGFARATQQQATAATVGKAVPKTQ